MVTRYSVGNRLSDDTKVPGHAFPSLIRQVEWISAAIKADHYLLPPQPCPRSYCRGVTLQLHHNVYPYCDQSFPMATLFYSSTWLEQGRIRHYAPRCGQTDLVCITVTLCSCTCSGESHNQILRLHGVYPNSSPYTLRSLSIRIVAFVMIDSWKLGRLELIGRARPRWSWWCQKWKYFCFRQSLFVALQLLWRYYFLNRWMRFFSLRCRWAFLASSCTDPR